MKSVYYIVSRNHDEKAAEDAVRDIQHQDNIRIADATWDRVRNAAQFKARGPLSYADAFACAIASEYNAAVITGDPEFSGVQDIAVHWLPQKTELVRMIKTSPRRALVLVHDDVNP